MFAPALPLVSLKSARHFKIAIVSTVVSANITFFFFFFVNRRKKLNSKRTWMEKLLNLFDNTGNKNDIFNDLTRSR